MSSPDLEIDSWVFLSHSNLDYYKVRIVRNILEEYNKRPIMFFLKCMTDKKELDPLLRREIDSRQEFILCDSENARASECVQDEVGYIKSKGRRYQTIDLNASEEQIRRELLEFTHRNRVFLSYARRNSDLAKLIRDALRIKGFETFDPESNILGGESLGKRIFEEIDKTAADGYMVYLLSEESEKSQWIDRELYRMLRSGEARWIVPVIVSSNFVPSPDVRYLMGMLAPALDVSSLVSDKEKADAICRYIKKYDASCSR